MSASVLVTDCDVGKGVFALKRYAPGDLILVFHGRRIDRNDPIHFTAFASNLLQTGKETYILLDPPRVFVNHSCHPNSGIIGQRRLIALQEILPGEEIRFDDSTTMDDELWTIACRCGGPNCRGLITYFKFLCYEMRARYLAMGIVSGFIARRYRRTRTAILTRSCSGQQPAVAPNLC